MASLLSGGNLGSVVMLPSGFAILPEKPTVPGGDSRRSLLTVAFQIMEVSARVQSNILPRHVADGVQKIILGTVDSIRATLRASIEAEILRARRGHEGRFTVYVHASAEKPIHVRHYFIDRDIWSDQVVWGKISMVDADRRLLANALEDPDNQHFVLLSDSCVPLHTFNYVYDYLMHTIINYVDCFLDPGRYGNGRYAEQMLPKVKRINFWKGAQWFTMKRQHGLILVADSLYYSKFRDHCQPGLDGKDCIADEHYIPTFLNMVDPGGISTWSMTHVDWYERRAHPNSYNARYLHPYLLQQLCPFKLGSSLFPHKLTLEDKIGSITVNGTPLLQW
ncbi:glycosyltransferase BC10-like [Eucalyptus grandis]|uniref:glycosyltransferase BC10-like n=1 Tax=Eucalyptus grandis TaxID=71139 RepID=UPI00192E8A20|nr:glycosyltransferase BC10-like [Eucalyptus grandis]